MKILKIRENKLKLSLSCEEAAQYGLVSRAQSPRELRAAVERIFADRRELFRIEEKIIVEAYPKTDGSCDVFVTNLPVREQKDGEDAPRRVSLWSFASQEHLALALYVLLCERERANAAPLCERDGAVDVECHNELCDEGDMRPLADSYGADAFAVCDLVRYLKEKTGNDRTEKLKEAFRDCRLYKSESTDAEGGCAYILEIKADGHRQEEICTMCEFSAPIQHLGAEVLCEHAREISLDALLQGGG